MVKNEEIQWNASNINSVPTRSKKIVVWEVKNIITNNSKHNIFCQCKICSKSLHHLYQALTYLIKIASAAGHKTSPTIHKAALLLTRYCNT